MTIIDQLKQFDEMRGKEPIDPTVIQDSPEQNIPLIDPTPRNPSVPPEWLDEPETPWENPHNEFETGLTNTATLPPSPLIPPSVRRSPDSQGSVQAAPILSPEEMPDLLVMSRNGVCVGVWKGKETELPDESRKAIARIVLKQIQKGISEELESVIEKRGPRKKRTQMVVPVSPVTGLPIGAPIPAKRKPGRPRKAQA